MEWILLTIARFLLANSQYTYIYIFRSFLRMTLHAKRPSDCFSVWFLQTKKSPWSNDECFRRAATRKVRDQAKCEAWHAHVKMIVPNKHTKDATQSPWANTRENVCTLHRSQKESPFPVSETPYRKIRWKPSTWRGVRQVCDPVHADENEDDVDQEHKFHAFLESGLWRVWWLCKIGLLHSRSSFGRKSLIALSAPELSSVSWVHSGLEHSKQTSSSFRTVAARSTWQCTSCLHVLYGPNVCMCLRSTQ